MNRKPRWISFPNSVLNRWNPNVSNLSSRSLNSSILIKAKRRSNSPRIFVNIYLWLVLSGGGVNLISVIVIVTCLLFKKVIVIVKS